MAKETIRFRIRQDGKVEEKVEGTVGDTCESLTKELEKKLGDLENRIHTSDYYLKAPNKDVTLQYNKDQT